MLVGFLILIAVCQALGDRYIVVFHDHIDMSEKALHFDWLRHHRNPNNAEFETQDFVDTIVHDYFIPGFNGYSAVLSNRVAQLIESLHIVAIIEKDVLLSLNVEQEHLNHPLEEISLYTVQNDGPWGLNVRISSRERGSTVYDYPASAGSNVVAYVIDSGVKTDHPEFQGRAFLGKSFTDDNDLDEVGHGTHVAGTIGSKSFGVAKNVTLVSVKVADARGKGMTSNLIAGIEWAARDASDRKRTSNSKSLKALANISLGGGVSVALDRAVAAAIASGLLFVVAAGNSGLDACALSPARVPSALTVAASDIQDRLASFSERGKCVDIIAPGVDITSTWKDGKTVSISGTSMASPHVAGVVALALGERDFETPSQVHSYILQLSSLDLISGLDGNTPNRLLSNRVQSVIPSVVPSKQEPGSSPSPNDDPIECPFPKCMFVGSCSTCSGFGF